MGQSNSLSIYPLDMKCFALFSLFGVALGAPQVLPYGYGLAAYPYAGLPLAYNALHTGLVYPVAEAYVHDAAGDVAVEGSPEAVAYVHDAAGDVADDSSPEAPAYVHDATGDVSDNSSPEAEAYVHDPTGDARKKREADAQILLPGAYPYALPYAYHPLSTGLVYPVAEPYVHDASGDAAEEYVHDTTGDARKKREADAHPNGAVVPLEPKDVVDARADHLKAVAEALKA